MEKRWIAVVAGAACTAVGGAGTITVDDDGSADFNQIQAAVDFAVDGDQISGEAKLGAFGTATFSGSRA